jgi:PAS domain-containing protein
VLLAPGQLPPNWDDQTSQTPTLTGLVFGDYLVQLTVTDQNGNSGVRAVHIGAVATDGNGVVVNANPAAGAILGPMIAFGKNPWGLGDYWHLAGSIQRYGQYLSYG